MTNEERENAIRCLKLWIEREPQLQTYKTCLEALEQEPCEDVISRQAVLEKAYKIAGYDRNAYVVDVADIEALPPVSTEKIGRWISVSERLPEAEYGESDSVLVCFENGTQDVLYFNGGNWCYPTGEVYISVNHKNGWHNKVVAWMPLLKQYDLQESENKE